MSLRFVRPGDEVELEARVWNAAVQLARDPRFAVGAQGGSVERDLHTIYVRNDSGSTVAPYQVLGLDDPLITYASEPDEYLHSTPIFSGVTPTEAHRGKFGITLDYIEAGDVSKVCVNGVVPCTIDEKTDGGSQVISNAKYADILPGQRTTLQKADWGSALILWLGPLSGSSRPAYVRISNPNRPVSFVAQLNSYTLRVGTTPGTGTATLYQRSPTTGALVTYQTNARFYTWHASGSPISGYVRLSADHFGDLWYDNAECT